MSLLTKDKLEAMFNQSKLRQQKKREQKKLETKQRLQAIYHHQDQVLKKSIQERKKTTMDNLSKLIKKRPQNVRKSPQIESCNCYQDKWQLWETNETDLYQTIEELKEAELRGEGRINWDKWNELVQLTKEQINQYERKKI